jgi:hypothetical protein
VQLLLEMQSDLQTKNFTFSLEEEKGFATYFVQHSRRWNMQRVSRYGTGIDSHAVRKTASTSAQSNEIRKSTVNNKMTDFERLKDSDNAAHF